MLTTCEHEKKIINITTKFFKFGMYIKFFDYINVLLLTFIFNRF